MTEAGPARVPPPPSLPGPWGSLTRVSHGFAPLRVGHPATEQELEAFAASARATGRRTVVGALITDGHGRIYVQKRSLTREVFPGCWDLVGGHLEEGESVTQALRREVMEETGWALRRVGPVVELLDWEAAGVKRREADFLVTVSGDPTSPRLEAGKHVAARWLEEHELPLLLEGRSPDDRWVHDVVARGFALLREWDAGT